MEKKSQPLIFVGYCEDVKAYRLFDPNSIDVLFRQDVQFDERYPPMDPPSPSSSSLSSTSSTLLQDYASSKEYLDIDPPLPPPQNFFQVPKWAHDTVDAVGPLAGDPTDACRTHSQIVCSGLLSHAISDDPQIFFTSLGY